MRKLLLITLILSLLLLPIIAAKNVEVIIEHKNPQPQIMKMRSFSLNSEPIQNPKFETKIISENEFKELKKDKSVRIQRDIPKHIFLDTSVPLIEADTVWTTQQDSINISGEHQTVCILDTGAQTDHPALTGKNATCNIDCITTPGTCIKDCSATDGHGHGTHVAGIIVSTDTTYHGITQNTKYIPMKVCTDGGSCSNLAIYAAMDWCIANKSTYNISVISMSLGGGQNDTYCDSDEPSMSARINSSVENNISVVTATGNLVFDSPTFNITNHSAGISNPACMINAIRVGNTDNSDNMANSGLRHNFFTDIITAPGVGIWSTYPTNTYGSLSGTSMSTPHVSGIITLLNHYKKLESNTILTPSEIKQLFLDSGKEIDDTSETNQNYTRVNAYQTILYSDEQSPQTILISPEASLLTTTGNQTFSCNATDNLQLKNLTLNIYNSTGIFYNLTNSSVTNNTLTINTSINLSQTDDYTWNCLTYDNQSKYNQSTNRTISTYSIETSITPTNNTYTNNNQTTFNCSVESIRELLNITFNLYNSTTLLYQNATNITGTSNYSIFNYNLTNETVYYYNCQATNNNSQSSELKNHTITYDATAPQITLTAPADNLRSTTKSQTFTYSETETNPDSCILTINNENKSSFTQTLTDGTYYWNVTCTDLANNSNTSETRTLEIYTSSSSGGGSSSSSVKTYNPTEEQIKEGYSKKLKEKDKIKFKTKLNYHKLTLNKIETNKVRITIESDPITIILYLNAPQDLDLDDDNIADVELTLLGTNSYANIQIKEINKTIIDKVILPSETNKTNQTQPSSTTTENDSTKIIPQEKENKFLKKVITIISKIIKFFNRIFPF